MSDAAESSSDESFATQASILLVSGAPASGKSTLARQLARVLQFPLLSKDLFKETLWDALGDSPGMQGQTPMEISQLLSRTSMELLWSVAPNCPQVILEANFRPKSEYERGRMTALPGRKLEVYCRCSPEEAARRFARRATQAEHHPAHSMKTMSAELVAEFDRPIGVCPVIEVDCEAPVSIEDVVRRIQEHWPDLKIR